MVFAKCFTSLNKFSKIPILRIHYLNSKMSVCMRMCDVYGNSYNN